MHRKYTVYTSLKVDEYKIKFGCVNIDGCETKLRHESRHHCINVYKWRLLRRY